MNTAIVNVLWRRTTRRQALRPDGLEVLDMTREEPVATFHYRKGKGRRTQAEHESAQMAAAQRLCERLNNGGSGRERVLRQYPAPDGAGD